MNEEQALSVRKQATQRVMQKSLSLNQTRTLVQNLIQQHDPASKSTQLRKTNKVIESVKAIAVKDLDSSGLKEFRQVLKEKLGEIETLLYDSL